MSELVPDTFFRSLNCAENRRRLPAMIRLLFGRRIHLNPAPSFWGVPQYDAPSTPVWFPTIYNWYENIFGGSAAVGGDGIIDLGTEQ